MAAVRIRIVIVVALVALGAGPRHASGFAFLDGIDKGWRTPPHFLIDQRGFASVNVPDHALAAVMTTLQQWSGAAGRTLFTIAAAPLGAPVTGDGVSGIYLVDPAFLGGDTARTLPPIRDAEGFIIEADIYIVSLPGPNGLSNTWAAVGEALENGEDPATGGGCVNPEQFIEGVALHEMGHALGMAHSDVVGATMSIVTILSPCERSFGEMTLEQDDIDGIRALYNRRPIPRFGFACSGTTCTFDGTASTDDLGIVSYAWSFGDGGGASGAVVSHAFAAGSYDVQLTVADGDGRVAALTRLVTVPDPPPVAAFTLSCGGHLRCTGNASASTDNADIVLYTWSWGDGSTSSGASATHTYGAPATYLITLTVTDNSGNTDTEAQPSSVHFPFHTVGFYDAAVPEFQLRAGHEGSGTGTKAAISGVTGRPVAGDWNGDGVETVGLFAPAQGRFALRNSAGTGPPDTSVTFGPKNGRPLAGDWQNKGRDHVGVYGPTAGAFQLRIDSGSLSFSFTGGAAAWLPVAGDWNCDGTDTVGLYDPSTATFHLRNSHTTGGADVTFVFGTPGAGLVPIAGDWDGNGCDGVGVYHPASATFHLRNATSAGPADHTFTYGPAATLPIAGDWDDQ